MENIPKIIHQIWFQGENLLPENLKQMRNSYKLEMPNWELNLYNSINIENFIRQSYPQYYEQYCGLSQMITKVDLARCLYLHKFGGVYSDLDILCLGNISDLLNKINDGKIRIINYKTEKIEYSQPGQSYDAIFSEEWPFSSRPKYYEYKANKSISNSIMISKPNLNLWIDYVEFILKMSKNGIETVKDVFNSSGPMALSQLLENYREQTITLPCFYLQNCACSFGKEYYIPEDNLSDEDLLKKLKIVQTTTGFLRWGPLINLDKSYAKEKNIYTIHYSLRTWQENIN